MLRFFMTSNEPVEYFDALGLTSKTIKRDLQKSAEEDLDYLKSVLPSLTERGLVSGAYDHVRLSHLSKEKEKVFAVLISLFIVFLGSSWREFASHMRR